MPVFSLSESLSSLLAATVAFAIGTSVVLRDRSRDQFVLFAVFCFNLGLFHLGRFFYGFSGVALFAWFAQTISLLLPWSADRCFSSFVPAAGHRGGGRIQAAIVSLLVLAQAVALLFPDVASRPQWEIVPIVVAIYVIGGLLYAATRMWRAANAAQGTAVAPRLRYLFYASLLALALGSPVIPAVGPTVTAVYLYFVAQTLTRERLLDLPEVAGRIASMTMLVLAVTGLFALLLLWIPMRGVGSRSLFLFNAAVASFAVIVLIDPVRTEVESRIETWLFRERSTLRSILLQLRQKLVNVIDPDDLTTVLIEELRASNRVTNASLYLLDRLGTGLSLRGTVGKRPPARLDLAAQRPLLERMRKHGPLLRDVLQRERARERATSEAQAETNEILTTLDGLGASLALPILGSLRADREVGSPPDLLGALFVDDERLLEPFSREEIELFERVVGQAAVTVQNSAVYEERKERDRLAALGEMAAGLAHEIRNPLGAIKGAVQVVEPSMPQMDEQSREFLGVIVEEVDRLNRVVSQFLTYSRPFKGELAPVVVNDVVQSTLRLLSDEQRARVSAEPPSDSDLMVLGDDDALRQVLLNLILNALDAIDGMDPPGHVWLEVGVRARGLPSGDAVTIAVRDDGPGLSPHTITNLFVPFHTTKSGGTGLGLPISQRIVENHRGVIQVNNVPEGGARFTVVLPAYEGDAAGTAMAPTEPQGEPVSPLAPTAASTPIPPKASASS